MIIYAAVLVIAALVLRGFLRRMRHTADAAAPVIKRFCTARPDKTISLHELRR